MMKANKIAAVLGIGLALALGAGRMSAQSGYDLFQKALAAERADGNLQNAIQLYQRVVKESSNDRALTAKALLRLGDCYQKLGDDQARAVFDRLTREFADQKEEAGEARARLASLRPSGAAPSTMTTRRVWTALPSQDISTVSSNGRYVLYVDFDRKADLFLRDLVAGSERRLTNTGTEAPGVAAVEEQAAEKATFSRDGRQIAYSWFNGKNNRDELRLISLEGSGVPRFRRLFDNADVQWIYPFQWSFDGKKIAIQMFRLDRTVQIGLLDTDDGSFQVLRSVGWRGTTEMFFSADGKYLAYDLPQSDISQQRDVHVVAVDGSREVPVVVHPSNDFIVGWSPEGGRLLFASDRNGSNDLWAVSFIDGRPSGSPVLIKSDVGLNAPMGLTASGTLYYEVRGGREGERPRIHVSTVDFSTGQFTSPVVDVAESEYLQVNLDPHWSPDGKHLAYLSRRLIGSESVLTLRAMDTGLITQVRPRLTYVNTFSFAPDGRSVVVAGRDLKGRQGIFRVDMQTGETLAVVLSEHDVPVFDPVWSPDGRSVYLKRWIPRSKEASFVKRDLISGKEEDLIRRSVPALGSNTFQALGALHLSPDGQYIATGIPDATGNHAIVLIPTSGGGPRELIRVSPAEGLGVKAWAPDSRSVFLIKGRVGSPTTLAEQGREVRRVTLDGQVQELAPDLAVLGSIRVHADGRQVAFQVGLPQPPESPAEVWALENFLSSQKASR